MKLLLAGEQSQRSWSQRGAATASSITSSEIIIKILIENSLDDDKDDFPNESPEPIVGSTFGRAWMDFNLFLDWILLAACSWQDPKPEADDDDNFQYYPHPHINTIIIIIIMIIMSIIRSEVALPSLEVAAPQVLPLLCRVLPFKRWVFRIRLTE